MKKAIKRTIPKEVHVRSSDTSAEKRGSQWEALMKKFSEDNKKICKAVSVDIPRADRDKKVFPTGSQYEGSWDVLGMSGYGVYVFPNGVTYEGDFEDGMFHGDGGLRYPSGIVVRGLWKKGTLDDRSLIFEDGVRYSERDWDYCKGSDRRFSIEFDCGLQPAGKSYLTADQPTREIPEGYYDVCDGFYDPKTKAIYSADDITTIVRAPDEAEQIWIVDNCRSSYNGPIGARPDLYESWPDPVLNPVMQSRIASVASSFAGSWRGSDEVSAGRMFYNFQSVENPPEYFENPTEYFENLIRRHS